MSDNVLPPGLFSGLGLSSSDTMLREPARPGVPLAPAGIPPESDVRTHSPGAANPNDANEPAGWQENLGWLPLGYGDDRLVCMPRDPTCAYVYWDLSAQLIAQAFEGLLPARALLKLIHLSGQLMREVEIDLGMRGFYLRELPPGAEFRVELWAAGERGARLLKTARPVWLPPAEPSTLLDEQYLHIWIDAPLSATHFAAGRPHLWRAASNFPGWSHSPLTASEQSRPGYPNSASLPAGVRK